MIFPLFLFKVPHPLSLSSCSLTLTGSYKKTSRGGLRNKQQIATLHHGTGRCRPSRLITQTLLQVDHGIVLLQSVSKTVLRSRYPRLMMTLANELLLWWVLFKAHRLSFPVSNLLPLLIRLFQMVQRLGRLFFKTLLSALTRG